MTHMHITTWVLAIILLIVSMTALKSGNQKRYKVSHMILRVDYLLIILTGGLLLLGINLNFEYLGKILLGIVVIGLMEMILVRTNKGKNVTGVLIALVIAFIVILALGFRLPMGINFLA